MIRSARDSAVNALEQVLDSLARIARRRWNLHLHPSAMVESTLDEAQLLEHPDEDARIAVRSGARQIVRVDGARSVTNREICRSQLLR
jgi:hypothetical protein